MRRVPRSGGQGRCHGGDGGAIAAVGWRRPDHRHLGGDEADPNFWPYPTTLFDYIRRSMPWQQPRTLTNDEVYALTAYILALNKLIGENDTMNAETLPKVRMPNRDGFIIRFPEAL
jgi:cytochrome c